MRRTVLALALILALLSSTAVGMLCVNLAKANYFPPPSIEIFSPIPAPGIHKNASVLLSVRVNILPGEPAITYICYSLDGKANVTITNLAREDNVWYWTTTEGVTVQGTAFSAQASMDNLVDGNHTLIVYAHYANGKEMSRSMTFTVDSHSEYPEVVILYPQNTTYVSTEVPLTWTCDEQIRSADYWLDEHGSTTLAGNTTLTGLSNGTHTIKVYVFTERGQGNSQTVHFTVNMETQLQPEPFQITLVTIVFAASLSGVGIGLLVYFKKRKH